MRRESGETGDPRAQLLITATASPTREMITTQTVHN